jgi:hypothetical protein
MGLFGISPTYAPTKTTYAAPANEYELKIDREKHGRCANCGLQTHEVKQGLFFIGTILEPITNDIVLKGRCLVCNPVNSVGVSKAEVEDADEAVPIENNVNITISDSALVNIASSEVAQSQDKKCHQGCAERRLYLVILLVVLTFLVVIGFSLYATVGRPNTNVSQESMEDPNETSKIPSQTSSTVTSLLPRLTTGTTAEAISNPITIPPSDQLELIEAPTDTTAETATTTEEPATSTPLSETTTSSTRLRDETIEEDIESNVLSRGVKFSELAETDSRNLALDWLLHDDEMQLDVPDSNLYQRFILALLAFNSGSDFRSSVDWLSETDECVWEGVTCDVNGEIIKLELG